MKQKHAKTNNSMPSIPFFVPQHQRKTNKLQTKIRNQEIKNSAAGKMKKYVVIHLYHTFYIHTSLYTDSIHFLSQCGVFSHPPNSSALNFVIFPPNSVSHFLDLFCPYLYLDEKRAKTECMRNIKQKLNYRIGVKSYKCCVHRRLSSRIASERRVLSIVGAKKNKRKNPFFLHTVGRGKIWGWEHIAHKQIPIAWHKIMQK